MRDYGKVHTTFWTSDDFRGASESGRMLALYLLTGPHTTMLGCFRLPDGYVSEDLNWEPQTVASAFAELERNGFATRDEKSKWVIVHAYLKWNPLENPNQGIAAARLFEQIPNKATVKPMLVQALRKHSKHFPTTVLDDFITHYETLAETVTVTLPVTVTDTVSKPGTGTGVETETLTPPANTPSVNQPPELSTDAGEKGAGGKSDAVASETPTPAANDDGAERRAAERAEQVAALAMPVQLSIAARKFGINCQAANPLLHEMAAQGITPDTLTAACEEAKASKAKAGETEFGLQYVVSILRRWAKSAQAAQVTGAAVPAVALSLDDKAATLRTQARPGEDEFTFKQRVNREYAAFVANGHKLPAAPAPITLPENVVQLPEKTTVSEESRAALRAQLTELKKGKAS